MRKLAVYILLLAVCTAVSARNRYSIKEDNYHFGYISGSVGYTSLSYVSGDIAAKGGLGFMAGFGYEFRHRNFWTSAGLQFQSLQSSLTVNEYSYTPPVGGMDDMGRTVTAYHYTINQQDRQKWFMVDIPILAGYYNNGFYVGAGLKVAFPASVKSTVKGSYDIDADYDRYVGTVSDVHYYTQYPFEGKGDRYALRPMVSIAGEIGYDPLSSMTTNSLICHLLKIGLYFEYGISSIKTAPLAEPITINPNNIADVNINPYFATEKGTTDWTVPYFVGLKLTYMIGSSRSATATWHKGCQCYGY